MLNLFTVNKPTIIKDLKANGLKGYQPNFDCLLTIESLREAFKEHLKGEFNLEPFLFIEAAEKLKDLEKNEWLNASKDIVEKFFVAGSDYELNVDHQQKSNVLKFYKEITKETSWNLEKTAFEMFYSAFRFILNGTKKNNFFFLTSFFFY